MFKKGVPSRFLSLFKQFVKALIVYMGLHGDSLLGICLLVFSHYTIRRANAHFVVLSDSQKDLQCCKVCGGENTTTYCRDQSNKISNI